MQVELPHRLVRALSEAKLKHPAFKDKDNYYGQVDLDPEELKGKDREKFREVIKSDAFWKGNGSADYRAISRLLEAYWYVEEHGGSDQKVKNLQQLAPAINKHMQTVRRRWIFHSNRDGWLAPYFADEAEYHKAEKRRDYYRPAYVSITFKAIARGKQQSFRLNFHRDDLHGHPTVEQIFAKQEVLFATDELIKEYEADLKSYMDWSPQTGEQFIASGKAFDSATTDRDDDDYDPWSRRSRRRGRTEGISLMVDGQPAKLVMDDELHQGNDNQLVTYEINPQEEDAELEAFDNFNAPRRAILDDDDDDYDDDDYDPELEREIQRQAKEDLKDASAQKKVKIARRLPTHPVVRVFNLATHEFLIVHVANIEPYPYDEGLIDKLVLPEEHKQLIAALTSSVITKYSDIVSGKAMGIIVLCSGTPGTGKTLTAEVYSEVAKRPLYLVQCSQLGTDEAELEKELTLVLNRATRWRAILLIDEADVYIHERGEDITQNAIVGVFLRLLEYYQGILFLTTNRAMVVDDAIISRMTAHIRYEVPQGDDRIRLWKILTEQYKVSLSEEMLQKAVQQFPKISGRSIRQIIRLAKFMADHKMYGGRVSMTTLQAAAKFHNFSEDEEMAKETVADVQVHR